MAGPVQGRHVLDLACGHGRYSRELARRGAHVVGVDISHSLIAAAKAAEQEHPLGIRYLCADVSSPGPALEDGMFDVVVCGFGLSDIDDLDAALDTSPGLCDQEAGSCSRSCTHASQVPATYPVRGHRRTRTTWNAGGEPTEPLDSAGSRGGQPPHAVHLCQHPDPTRTAGSQACRTGATGRLAGLASGRRPPPSVLSRRLRPQSRLAIPLRPALRVTATRCLGRQSGDGASARARILNRRRAWRVESRKLRERPR